MAWKTLQMCLERELTVEKLPLNKAPEVLIDLFKYLLFEKLFFFFGNRVEEIEDWMASTDYIKAVDNLIKTKEESIHAL